MTKNSQNIIVTGSTGTIGVPLTSFLQQKGFNIIPWNRDQVSIINYAEMENFISGHKPDALIHLAAITSFDPDKRKNSWSVNYEWPSELAWICRIHNIRFIFTSTAMVFSNQNQGPFTIASIPDASEGYGYEKRKAEERIIYQNPDAVILRLGWQIAQTGNNSMITALDHKMIQEGSIHANKNWLPSCSFIQDTTRIFSQSLNFPPGIYMVNSNDKWNFYEIVRAISFQFEKNWHMIPIEGNTLDQRMMDERIQTKKLDSFLKI